MRTVDLRSVAAARVMSDGSAPIRGLVLALGLPTRDEYLGAGVAAMTIDLVDQKVAA